MNLRSAKILILSVVLSFAVDASTASAGWFFCRRSDSESGSEEQRRCCCLLPAEPPRGEVVIALPARVNLESLSESEEESESEASDADSRLDQLERDMTRLTVIVEEMIAQQGAQQAKNEREFTRIATILEELVRGESSGKVQN